MMKRTISVLTALAVMVSGLLSQITGCSGSSDSYTTGEWLNMVEENFSLTYYEQAEPYFASITADNDLFSVSQIAAEWGVVDTDQELNLDKKVTKEFCADTLVRAMAFDNESTTSIADEASVKHPQTAKIAVDEGILSLDNAGKFNPGKILTRKEASTALAIARDKWINVTYDETYDNSKVREGVINLGGLSQDKSPVASSNFNVAYSGDTNVIDSDGNYDISGLKQTITLPKADAVGVQSGSIITLPADNVVPTPYAVSVESITDNGNGTVTVKAHSTEMMDVYENLDVQYSDYLNYDEAVFFDPDGNRIADDASSTALSDIPQQFTDEYLDSMVKGLITPENQLIFQKLKAGVTKTKTIKLDMFTVKVSYSSEKIDVSIEVELDHGKVTFKKQIPKIRIDTKFDIGWVWDWGKSGIKVKKARFVVRLEDSMSFKYSGKWSASYVGDVNANKEDYNFISDTDATISHDEVLKQAYDKFRKQYEIIKKYTGKDSKVLSCTLFEMVFPTGAINPKFVVRLNISIEGNISLSCETKSAFGGEVVNNKLRIINESTVKKSASLDGKAEATVAFGFALSALGTTAADLMVNAGVGVKLSITAVREDAATNAIKEQLAFPNGMGTLLTFKDSGELTADTPPLFSDDGLTHTCANFQIYPIAYIEICSSKSLVGKFIGGVKLSYKDENNGDSIKKHIEFDDGVKVVDKCSYVNEQVGGITIKSGKDLELNDEKVLVPVDGDTNYITVTTIPKKYKLKDFVISCDDTSVAEATYSPVDTYKNKAAYVPNGITFTGANGKTTTINTNECFYKDYTANADDLIRIKGISDGTTTFTLKSKDGKYSKTVTVIVGNGGLEDASVGTLLPETYSYLVAPGGSVKIELSAVPKNYIAGDITYSSSDESVASVDQSGKVTGKQEGSAIVTIATSDGKYTALVEINVMV